MHRLYILAHQSSSLLGAPVQNMKDTFSLTVQAYVTAGTVIIQRMWRGSMHGSLIWKDCDLLGSFEGTKLPNGWLQAYFSSRAMQLAHMEPKSWSALLVFCAGRSISIRQDTGVNNNGLPNSRLCSHRLCPYSWCQSVLRFLPVLLRTLERIAAGSRGRRQPLGHLSAVAGTSLRRPREHQDAGTAQVQEHRR
ncbi:uncharacterized protein LOC142785107 isoform X1 [Rhipicephalus microplus]|uniref:uncharacterized protein LOC142785107 isoform X1 n=1 Tax=Rhipicephalus microplus TaxID=6941 RepID=UPI003F6D0657